MSMIFGLLLIAGIIVTLFGFINLIKPFWIIRSQKQAGYVAIAGVLVVIISMVGGLSTVGNKSDTLEADQVNTSDETSDEDEIESSNEGPALDEPEEEPAAEEEEDSEVTKAEYDQIKNGMSYKEVVSIIGFEGEENSQNEIAGTKTIMYTWMNDNGSNMNAMFQNDKLIQKAQFGLK